MCKLHALNGQACNTLGETSSVAMEMQYYDHHNLMNFKLVFKIQSIYKSNKKLHFSTGA